MVLKVMWAALRNTGGGNEDGTYAEILAIACVIRLSDFPMASGTTIFASRTRRPLDGAVCRRSQCSLRTEGFGTAFSRDGGIAPPESKVY